MDLYSFIIQIIESQGLIAGLLVYLIIQNNVEKRAMLSKICELNHFIMKMLDRELKADLLSEDMPCATQNELLDLELEEDLSSKDVSRANQRVSKTQDLLSDG